MTVLDHPTYFQIFDFDALIFGIVLPAFELPGNKNLAR
jgi:hypothetical protein